MKKTTKIVTVVLMVVIVGIVGVYAFVTGRAKSERESAALTAVDRILTRDLVNHYPGTPKEVIKYYSEIVRCFYSSDTSDEDLERLGLRARELFDAELLENNEQQDYLIKLKADVQEFKRNNLALVNIAVADSVNVDIFQEDGFDFARLGCGFSIAESGRTRQVVVVYLLRRDENKRWKIYGWEDSQNLNQRLGE